MSQAAEADQPDVPDEPADRGGFRINEDWAATAIGLVLVLLVLGGIIVKGMIP